MSGVNFVLRNGSRIPALGFGTWQAKKDEVGNAVRIALENGYKHIDGASIYSNEQEIGEVYSSVFSAGKIDRSSVFITSKLWNNAHHPDDVAPACQKTLDDLRLTYLDLYLIHWPVSFQRGKQRVPVDENKRVLLDNISINDTWRAMEELVDRGKVRNIGVSNFSVAQLKELLSTARIVPAVNQIEAHPYLPQEELHEFCKPHKIHLSAYSPLGSGKRDLLDDPKIQEIAKEIHRTPAQVLLRWGTQTGFSVLPKSVTQTRIIENAQLDFDLTPAHMQAIANIPRRVRFNDPTNAWKLSKPLFDPLPSRL